MSDELHLRPGEQLEGSVATAELHRLRAQDEITENDPIHSDGDECQSAASADTHTQSAPVSTAARLRSWRAVTGRKLTLLLSFSVLLAVVFRDHFRHEPSYDTIMQHYEAVLDQAHQLAERDASDEEWAAFEDRSLTALGPSVRDLNAACERQPKMMRSFDGSTVEHVYLSQFVRWPLLQIGQYRLPRLFHDCRAGQPIDRDSEYIERDIGKAKDALGRL